MTSRVLRILKYNRPYDLRDIDGRKITKTETRRIVKERYWVPEEIWQRLRNRKGWKQNNFSNIQIFCVYSEMY
ncbi:MAG: hypothetical protein ABIK93_06240 [candidate division WOR-3 bacterium]